MSSFVSNPYAAASSHKRSYAMTWCMTVAFVLLTVTSRGYHNRKERRSIRSAKAAASSSAANVIPKGGLSVKNNIVVDAEYVESQAKAERLSHPDYNNNDDNDNSDLDSWNPLSITDTLGAAAETAGEWLHQTTESILGEDIVHSAGEMLDSGLDQLGDWPIWLDFDDEEQDDEDYDETLISSMQDDYLLAIGEGDDWVANYEEDEDWEDDEDEDENQDDEDASTSSDESKSKNILPPPVDTSATSETKEHKEEQTAIGA